MKHHFVFFLFLISFVSCQSNLEKYAKQYQKEGDLKSLEQAMALIPAEIDTSYVKKILGEPIDMGFDYRYLTDEIGENNCPIGAVFHIDESGNIDDRWIGEICE